MNPDDMHAETAVARLHHHGQLDGFVEYLRAVRTGWPTGHNLPNSTFFHQYAVQHGLPAEAEPSDLRAPENLEGVA